MTTGMISTMQSEAVRRQAIAQRDPRFDGSFVFGVRSTGIYCRPSCPARRPRPDQVVFFDAPEAAERTGYRPCRRCFPRAGDGMAPAGELARLCGEIGRMLASEPDRMLTTARLAEVAGTSEHSLARLFRKHLGVTPRQYVDSRRVGEVKSHLRRSASVTEAIYAAGYGSSSRLYERAASHLGMTPAAYRRGGDRVDIRYTTASCPLGRLLVAVTPRGIAAVYLGERDARLAAELAREFPRARIRRDGAGFERWVSAIVEHLGGRQPKLDLPLDVRSTAFQRQVWEELRRTPYGSTRSYSAIARAIGRPRAVRAVARACATNPASIVIPCHRAVREDGSLAGYRWGLERKRALLAKEKAQAIRISDPR